MNRSLEDPPQAGVVCDTKEANFLPAKVSDLVASAYKAIKAKLPLTLRSMSLYLSNKDTEFILFKPVRVSFTMICLNVGWSFQVCSRGAPPPPQDPSPLRGTLG